MLNHAGAAPVTIGIALPQGQVLQGAEVTEPMRQSLISQLKAQSIDAVPLSASSDNLDAEAQAKQCRYVLYTHLEKRSSGGLGKLSALTHALPFGGFSAKSLASSVTSTALQGAANAAASSAQQKASSPLGTPYVAVKQGDTVAMAYRLVAVASTNPVKAETFDSNKASSDGQDIVSPLVAQVVGAVSAATQDTPLGQTVTPAASSDPPSSTGRRSLFGGFGGHRIDSSAACRTHPCPLKRARNCRVLSKRTPERHRIQVPRARATIK
jgi:hypothetical protein